MVAVWGKHSVKCNQVLAMQWKLCVLSQDVS